MEKEAAIIEAVLFIESEPQDEAALSRISGLAEGAVGEALGLLTDKYAAEDSGVELARVSGGWALRPKQDVWESLREHYARKGESRLSRAAIETLAIVAYSQPITRAEIEAIRGVSADNMIRLLSERGFVKEVGKKDVPGKPVQFGTTKEFLRFFRLNSIADLPQLEESEHERFELR